MVTAIETGAYLARWPLTIHDGVHQAVIGMTVNGPWFSADLPRGRYTVEVSHGMDEGLELVFFHWGD